MGKNSQEKKLQTSGASAIIRGCLDRPQKHGKVHLSPSPQVGQGKLGKERNLIFLYNTMTRNGDETSERIY